MFISISLHKYTRSYSDKLCTIHISMIMATALQFLKGLLPNIFFYNQAFSVTKRIDRNCSEMLLHAH